MRVLVSVLVVSFDQVNVDANVTNVITRQRRVKRERQVLFVEKRRGGF